MENDQKVMVSHAVSELKPRLRRRLEFIDFRLLWNARLNRSEIAEQFRISTQQASADIAEYEKLAPGNLLYDRALRRYVRSADYQPVLVGGMSDRYLMQLGAMQMGLLPATETWFLEPPPVDVASLRPRKVEDDLLRSVLDAMRDRRELLVDYASMSGTPRGRRWIGPHAIAEALHRWHARCYSPENRDFRDFNLNRIRRVLDVRDASVAPTLDLEWQTRVDLVLEPNPDYSEDMKVAVRDEFEFDGERLVVATRTALVFYLMHEHNLEPHSDGLPHSKRQLVLVNGEEVARAREGARETAKRLIDAAHPIKR